MDNQVFSKIGKLLVKSKNILIFLPAQPSVDSAAAGLAFYLSLKATGKQAAIVCSEKITVGLNRLIAVDKIQNQVAGQNLVVSFEYLEDSIEKVSYNINNNKFNLVIQPKEGFSALDSQKLEYSYIGANADLVIMIGAPKLESLGRLYQEEQKLFTEQETINIDVNAFNSRYGKTNFLDSQASSCSELIGLIIKNLNMTVNPDVTTDLLAGMEAATNNFTMRTRAETYELVGWAMHNGGRRLQMQTAPVRQPFNNRQFMDAPGVRQPAGRTYGSMSPQPSAIRQPAAFDQPAFNPEPQVNYPQNTAANPHPAPFTFGGSQAELSQIPVPSLVKQSGNPGLDQFPKSASAEPTPPEWLKPKIYKGSSQI